MLLMVLVKNLLQVGSFVYNFSVVILIRTAYFFAHFIL
jgi:hypothetical protein